MRELAASERLNRWGHAGLLALALLLLLGMLLRNVGQPLLDRHSWRQVDTASFARGLARGEFDLFHPRFLAYYPDAYGIDGATETEFNLYPLLVAGLYKLLGIDEVVARLVSIAFSLGTAAWVYLMGRQYLNHRAALLAVLFMGLSPLYVYYGRNVQPDATALFFAVGCLYLFGRWLERVGWAFYAATALCGALAFLTKISLLFMGLPLLALAYARYRGRTWREWRLWALALAMLLPVGLYYRHAHSLYQQTGLTVYGIGGGWPGSGKFDTLGQLLSDEFYRAMFARLRGPILGRYGLALLLLGLLIRPQRRELPLYAWLAAAGLFVLGVAQGNRQHEYYQLPLVPVAALFIGKALDALLNPETLRLDLLLVRRRVGMVLSALLLLLHARGIESYLAPMYTQARVLLDVAQATQAWSPAGGAIVIMHDWARVPEVFYYADRRGWSLWLERTPAGEYGRLIVAERQMTPDGWRVVERLESDIARLEMLRSLGATRLVVSLERGTAVEFLRSPIGQMLSARYPLLASEEHWIIYDVQGAGANLGLSPAEECAMPLGGSHV